MPACKPPCVEGGQPSPPGGRPDPWWASRGDRGWRRSRPSPTDGQRPALTPPHPALASSRGASPPAGPRASPADTPSDTSSGRIPRIHDATKAPSIEEGAFDMCPYIGAAYTVRTSPHPCTIGCERHPGPRRASPCDRSGAPKATVAGAPGCAHSAECMCVDSMYRSGAADVGDGFDRRSGRARYPPGRRDCSRRRVERGASCKRRRCQGRLRAAR